MLLSSHAMALVEQLCDTVAVLAGRHESSLRDRWRQVRCGRPLEQAFIELAGAGAGAGEALSWLAR